MHEKGRDDLKVTACLRSKGGNGELTVHALDSMRSFVMSTEQAHPSHSRGCF